MPSARSSPPRARRVRCTATHAGCLLALHRRTTPHQALRELRHARAVRRWTWCLRPAAAALAARRLRRRRFYHPPLALSRTSPRLCPSHSDDDGVPSVTDAITEVIATTGTSYPVHRHTCFVPPRSAPTHDATSSTAETTTCTCGATLDMVSAAGSSTGCTTVAPPTVLPPSFGSVSNVSETVPLTFYPTITSTSSQNY
eukprot:PhM_4_TR11674/c0_g1_i1/m.13362